ncbi:PREDICTED: uncharacterized protein LOC106128257 isoform X2 [Papilio xuthus]|uniref:Uncharacterized protein LOC106128257 isoform X2 n=1 Tax=Papilio xuthus TaxID=66420 RepID=A0AAJ6ZYT5_PAPXU|nr:PREDICTED: uncharacterized protein LOC106128257 isoform X2 [Papilio xuthus]
MYHMKTIVPVEDNIMLPQCMYYLKNPNNNLKIDEVELNISDQVMRFLKNSPNKTMIELEQRQTQLLQKLDVLYDRIKTISTLCKLDVQPKIATRKSELILEPEEIVVVLDPKILPSFLGLFLKRSPNLHVTWHIHSSVSTEDSFKIKDFFKNKPDLSFNNLNANKIAVLKNRTNLRLIFKNASAELRMSSLDVPLVGIVNILRFLCLLYPTVIQYDQNDYFVDNLLDQCHLLEKTSGKQMEDIITQIFFQCKGWVYKNELSIVDVAAFIIIQMKGVVKAVPKTWYNKCEKTFM